MKERHVPIRQCVVCKRRMEKGKLQRFVRTVAQDWVADPAGRLFGRGAYLCSAECAERVKRNKRYKTLSGATAGISQ